MRILKCWEICDIILEKLGYFDVNFELILKKSSQILENILRKFYGSIDTISELKKKKKINLIILRNFRQVLKKVLHFAKKLERYQRIFEGII